MINVYPQFDTDIVCRDYSVKINGKDIPLNTARVSAIPFNRRWPGHQRDISQSELINFASFSISEPVELEITPPEPFSDYKIRPQSLELESFINEKGNIVVRLPSSAYFTIEPYGINRALHIFADPAMDYGADKNSPEVIYYGAGIHDVGLINLKDGQTLFIDEGAVVYACVRAYGVKNIRIVGGGILDNSRNHEKILYDENAEGNTMEVKNAERLHTVQIEYCDNIEIKGITIRDSLVYNIRPIACRGIKISNVKIIGCWRYNSDGIDMHNCEDVEISDCFIRTFDDSICVKGFDCYGHDDGPEYGGVVYDTFKNVDIHNCVIWTDWGKSLEIGAETRAEEICNVHFHDCDVIHVSSGAPCDCMNSDYADIHDIIYEDIRIEFDDVIRPPKIQQNDDDIYSFTDYDYSPSMINVGVVFHEEYSDRTHGRGKNRNFIFKNISLFGHQQARAKLKGFDEKHKTENILLENITKNGKKLTAETDGFIIANEFTSDIMVK